MESVSNELKKNDANEDEDVNILIALEMSRLQAIEDDLRRKKSEKECVGKGPESKVVVPIIEKQKSTTNDADVEDGSTSVDLSEAISAELTEGATGRRDTLVKPNWSVDLFLKSLTINDVDLKNFCPTGPPRDKVKKKSNVGDLTAPRIAAKSQPSSPMLSPAFCSGVDDGVAFKWPPRTSRLSVFDPEACFGRGGKIGLARSQRCSPWGMPCASPATTPKDGVMGGKGLMPRIRIISHSESSQDLSETGIPRSPTLFIR